MLIQTEAKAQGWRALVSFDDGRQECLLYLGRSSTAIRNGYVTAFFELLDEEEREHASCVSLQKWHGAPDAGRWLHQTNLRLPSNAKVARSA